MKHRVLLYGFASVFLFSASRASEIELFQGAYGPGGTKFTISGSLEGYRLTISSVEKQSYSDSSYAVTAVGNLEGYCTLNYKVDSQASKVSLIDDHDQTVTSFASSGQFSRAVLPFRLEADRHYRLVFYKPERIDAPVVYHDVTLDCIESLEIANPEVLRKELVLLGLNQFANAAMRAAIQGGEPTVSQLTHRFIEISQVVLQKIQDTNNPYNLAFYLSGEYRKLKSTLKNTIPRLQEDQLWPWFVANIAHFSLPLTRQDKVVPRDILLDGGGTCWQQATVATYFYELPQTDDHASTLSSDPYVLGHAFFVGRNFISDVTNNIFIPVSVFTWNELEPFERFELLRTSAIYGISLDLHEGQGRSESLKIFSQDVLNHGYYDTLTRLPYARLMDPKSFDPNSESPRGTTRSTP